MFITLDPLIQENQIGKVFNLISRQSQCSWGVIFGMIFETFERLPPLHELPCNSSVISASAGSGI
jgi:hypothetical protein